MLESRLVIRSRISVFCLRPTPRGSLRLRYTQAQNDEQLFFRNDFGIERESFSGMAIDRLAV